MRSLCVLLAASGLARGYEGADADADAHVAIARAWTPGQVVNTTSGPVRGRAAKSAGNAAVSEYLSIPYAAPPLDELRWRPPQPFRRTAEVDATRWGPSCAQAALPSSSEDCLTLNIWTKPQSGSAKKAVMINIYGGGFNVGSSNTRYLSGASLANHEDVVVVSMNYRLNVFGFPGAPGLQDNNLGMLDIRASIEWARDNIAQFGGDPQRMILFGESAGGGAVDYYAFAYPDDPIVKGLIPMSGSVYTRGIAVPATGNLDGWYNVSRSLGCGGREAGAATVACLRKKPSAQLLRHVRPGPRTPGKTFGPVHDGRVIFSEAEYLVRARQGRLARLPTLTGNTHNEAGFFTLMRQLAPADQQRLNNIFTCVAARTAADRLANGIPVWRYRWLGDFANNRRRDGMGAFHGSELPFVFGAPKTLDSDARSTDTPDEVALTRQLGRLWAAFARDPGGAPGQLGLRPYRAAEETLLLLGQGNKAEFRWARGDVFDGPCAAYERGSDSIDGVLESAKPVLGGFKMPGGVGAKGSAGKAGIGKTGGGKGTDVKTEGGKSEAEQSEVEKGEGGKSGVREAEMEGKEAERR